MRACELAGRARLCSPDLKPNRPRPNRSQHHRPQLLLLTSGTVPAASSSSPSLELARALPRPSLAALLRQSSPPPHRVGWTQPAKKRNTRCTGRLRKLHPLDDAVCLNPNSYSRPHPPCPLHAVRRGRMISDRLPSHQAFCRSVPSVTPSMAPSLRSSDSDKDD